MDRSKVIFANEIPKKVYNKAEKSKKKYLKKFGNDYNTTYHLSIKDNETIGSFLGVKNLEIGRKSEKIIFKGNRRKSKGEK